MFDSGPQRVAVFTYQSDMNTLNPRRFEAFLRKKEAASRELLNNDVMSSTSSSLSVRARQIDLNLLWFSWASDVLTLVRWRVNLLSEVKQAIVSVYNKYSHITKLWRKTAQKQDKQTRIQNKYNIYRDFEVFQWKFLNLNHLDQLKRFRTL